jgi:hypothetical protein
VISSGVYLLVRCLLGCLMVLARREVSKDAELLVLRHENAVLRRQIGRVGYEPTDRLWLAALSRLIPRRRWGEVFAVTPGTLLRSQRTLRTSPTTSPHQSPALRDQPMQQCPPPVHQRKYPSGGQPRTPRTGRSACSQHEYGERIKMVAVADASSQAGIKGRGQRTMQRAG